MFTDYVSSTSNLILDLMKEGLSLEESLFHGSNFLELLLSNRKYSKKVIIDYINFFNEESGFTYSELTAWLYQFQLDIRDSESYDEQIIMPLGLYLLIDFKNGFVVTNCSLSPLQQGGLNKTIKVKPLIYSHETIKKHVMNEVKKNYLF